MTGVEKDPLSPSSKDPAEGARGPSEGGAAVGGLSGQGGSPAGGTPTPSGGDGTAPK